MTQINLNSILKQVSRSFYLSIRILPESMQTPVGIAYLLARAADSMTDSDQINPQVRANYLNELLNLMTNYTQDQSNALSDTLAPKISDPGENTLIQNLPEIIINYHRLKDNDKTLVQDVVNTLVKGMQKDLNIFHSHNQIVALENNQALDEYTYLVAGCVGEFWTKSAIIHLPSIAHWDTQTQSKLGIEFGKALQLTNILRDIAKDARLGRCYLPNDELNKYNLNTSQLLNKDNDELFRPIIHSHLQQTLKYFNSAEHYLLSTPRINLRLRLASIWPILIGLKTLELIANKENYLDPEKNIKVSRNWVYSMLLRSLIIAGSNSLLKRWIHAIRKNIEDKIQQHEGLNNAPETK